jgi:glucose-1-phosphate thymidylyltransferase
VQGVILAAGKGTRLHPITLKRSKAMAPIMGKPIVERVMAGLVENGVRDFVLVVSPEDGELKRHFLERSDLDVSIQFVIQPERLGMANALRLAAPHLRGDFILSACDNLVSPAHIADLLAAHRARSAQATLSLMEIDLAQASRTGVVEWRDERIWRIVEKPAPEAAPSNISSLPLYVFSAGILDLLPAVKLSVRGEYELQDAIQMLIEQNRLVTGVLTESRLQLTNSSDLLALNRHYLAMANKNNSQIIPRSLGQHTRLLPPLHIEEGVTIGPGCIIGPGVYIERNCRVGANVLIKDSVILRDAIIEDGRQIVGEVIS